jgi:zinc transporter ZupT
MTTMSKQRAATAAGLCICCSVAIFAAIFLSRSFSRSLTEMEVYGIGLLPLLLALYSCILLWPHRSSFAIRIFFTFTALIAAFLALEVIGGFAWFLLDKLVRHYQHS